MDPLRTFARTLLKGYAAIFFAESPLTGALVLAATFWRPGVGASGLVAATFGWLIPSWMDLPWAKSPLYVCNAALGGLFLAGFAGPSWRLLPPLLLGVLLVVALTAILMNLLWRLDHLPVLSLPFILGTWALMSAVRAGGSEEPLLAGTMGALPMAAQGFLKALGSVVCTPHPLPGLLILVGVLANSRLLALFAMAGFLGGAAADGLLGTASPWTAFNSILVALALGGVFLVPSGGSLLVVACGLGWAVLATALGGLLLAASGLPVLAMPFVVATLLMLAALRRRVSMRPPHLVLDSPALPEANLERARLARARGVDPGSVSLSVPFFGEWQVYQGFDGAHTHREAWRFAMDFFIQEGRRSHSGEGRDLQDYHCFGLPVRAPAGGTVAACQDGLPDNPPGHVDATHNWGNHVLLQLPSGLFVLLAHLRQGSLKVAVGDHVAAGDPLAACGSSGRSPQPHLHLHVQTEARLGSRTFPFHLAGVVGRAPDQQESEFSLFLRPGEGWSIRAGSDGPGLSRAFLLPAQRVFTYRVQGPGGGQGLRRLQVEQDLAGTFLLRSDHGAHASFERTDTVFGCYDRRGPRDDFFDLWLLALGFTPLAPLEVGWRDAPPSRILPAPGWRRAGASLFLADLLGLRSRYRRRRTPQGLLRQTGLHLHPLPQFFPRAVTEARIHPDQGPISLKARVGGQRWSATLISLSMAEGTPGLVNAPSSAIHATS
ncbi:MAG: urea transporter [Geothrix sp.]|nr:urea transporter [Geothrix sp.]